MAFSSNIVTINRLKTAFTTLRDRVTGTPSSTGVSGTTLADQIKTLKSGKDSHDSSISSLNTKTNSLQTSVNSLNSSVSSLNSNKITKANLLSYVYPVGAIYMSTNSTSPASFLGGTWERIQDRFLLAAGSTYSAGGTGGEATHKLTTAEMPSHSHTVNSHSHSIGDIGGTAATAGNHTHDTLLNGKSSDVACANNHSYSVSKGNNAWVPGGEQGQQALVGKFTIDASGWHTHSVSNTATNTGNANPGTSSAGSSSAHNNMPPYLVVYVWKRTA